MSIRYRLAAVIAGIVVPVLVAVGLVMAVLLPQRLAQSQAHELEVAARSIASAMTYECGALGYRAQVIALDIANGQDPARVLKAQQGARTDTDSYDIVRVGSAAPVVRGSLQGDDATHLAHPRCSLAPGPIDRTTNGTPVLAEQATVETTRGAIVVTSLERITPPWLRAAKAQAKIEGTHITIYCASGSTTGMRTTGDVVWREAAATAGQPCDIRAGEAAPAGQRYRVWSLLVLGLALAASLGVIVWLANALTGPIRAVSAAARRATAGDREARVPVTGHDEIAELGRDFNVMVGELDGLITVAQDGRNRLRDTALRLGDVLRRTHDLDGMLAALCALAETTAGAERAAVWMTEGSGLRVRTVHPIGTVRPEARRLDGEGSLPMSAVTRLSTCLLEDASGDPASVLGGRMVALPLVSGEQVLGVLVAERPASAPPFDGDEIERLELAIGSAGVAVDNAILHRAAQRQSVVDPLTGVGNLRFLTSSLGREIERGRRFDRSVAVMIVDIDHFRRLNDELGPSVGDGVLTALAGVLTGHVRSVDTVARYGGEEFAVVCPELELANAARAAQRLVDAVREATLDVLGVQVKVTVSVGIACYPLHGTAALDLITAADDAMAQAKREGRDRAVVAPPLWPGTPR